MTTEAEAELLQLAFKAIAQIVESVAKAKSGAIDSDQVIAIVGELHDELSANNAAADAAVDAKFPKG
jgi:hypothetical protein